MKKKEIKEVNCGGDGTGYGFSVKKNYTSEAKRLKEKLKVANSQGNHTMLKKNR